MNYIAVDFFFDMSLEVIIPQNQIRSDKVTSTDLYIVSVENSPQGPHSIFCGVCWCIIAMKIYVIVILQHLFIKHTFQNIITCFECEYRWDLDR